MSERKAEREQGVSEVRKKRLLQPSTESILPAPVVIFVEHRISMYGSATAAPTADVASGQVEAGKVGVTVKQEFSTTVL